MYHCNIRSLPTTKVTQAIVWFVFVALVFVPGLPLQGQSNTVPLVTAKLVSGESVTGILRLIDIDSVTIQNQEDLQTIPHAKLESVRFGPSELKSNAGQLPPFAKLILADGSILNASKVQLTESKLSIQLFGSDAASLKTRDVDAILFKFDGTKLEQQARSVAVGRKDRQGDTLIVNRDGDFNAIEGVARSLSEGRVAFSVGEQTAEVDIEKLDALTFFHAVNREFEKAPITCQLRDGSLFQARRVLVVNAEGEEASSANAAGDDQRLRIVTLAGPVFDVAHSSVHQMVFGSGMAVKLSDLIPATNDWQPLLASPAIVESLRQMRIARINQSFSGDPLRVESIDDSPFQRKTIKTFNSGFAIAGGGRLAFRLGGEYKRLRGLIAFAPTADERGMVRMKISADGEEIFNQTLAKVDMAKPLPIDFVIEGRDRVLIEVGYHDGRSVGDQLHLVDLVLSK